MSEERYAFTRDISDDQLQRQLRIYRDEVEQLDRDIDEMSSVPPDTFVLGKTYKNRKAYEQGKPVRRTLHKAGSLLRRFTRKRKEAARNLGALEREHARRQAD